MCLFSYIPILFFIFTLSSVKSQFNLGLLETAKNPFQYLDEQNYPYENHTVTTEDGYNLLLVRIPYNRNQSPSNTFGPPILFVHGILANFYDFLISGPGIAFGFRALEKGYDVFLLNTRGNRWSRSHIILDPDSDSKRFWNFSYHELGVYDLPATINYITNLTGYSSVSYVGHSQGTTALLAMTSTRPEYNKKINIAVLLAPVAYLQYAQFAPIALLKHFVDFAQEFVEALNLHEVLPYNIFVSEIGRLICSPNSIILPVCRKSFYEFSGPSSQINNSIISAYITNYPSGASAKEIIHFLQNANSGKFGPYDYGEEGNLAEYGQSSPPDYNLSAITSPIVMYYGSTDYFVAGLDEKRLAKQLPNLVKNVLIPYPQANHFDLLIGTMTEKLVPKPALIILNRYNNF